MRRCILLPKITIVNYQRRFIPLPTAAKAISPGAHEAAQRAGGDAEQTWDLGGCEKLVSHEILDAIVGIP